MKQSCIHIYCGDGKGKSTAVTGLAVRAAGSGRRVIFTQFMKDGKSSELKVLRELPGVTVLTCEKQFGFFWNMTDEQKKEAANAYQELMASATKSKKSGKTALSAASASALEKATGISGVTGVGRASSNSLKEKK